MDVLFMLGNEYKNRRGGMILGFHVELGNLGRVSGSDKHNRSTKFRVRCAPRRRRGASPVSYVSSEDETSLNAVPW